MHHKALQQFHKFRERIKFNIHFPDEAPRYDMQRMLVVFPATLGKRLIPCAITLDALRDHFNHGASSRASVVFLQNRTRIEIVATRLIMQRRFQRDGSILIRSADCNVERV